MQQIMNHMNSCMRKICVFTSTRADFGLLSGLLRELQQSSDVQLKLFVSGTHLSKKHGYTLTEIEAAGFHSAICVPIFEDSDGSDSVSLCKIMGRALERYASALMQEAPDILVVLGDRYEALCVVTVAQMCRVPVAHIHGGERTEGAVDEAFRHSITKMSHLHFPCCEEYRQRIIQLGEHPQMVFNAGALGVENARSAQLMSREEISQLLLFDCSRPYLLVTLHPETLSSMNAVEQAHTLVDALKAFPDYGIIFTGANADHDGATFDSIFREFVEESNGNAMCIQSMGYRGYLSAMKQCASVVGNSSSGILEAPAFNIPAVNIGDRQRGRVRAKNVIDCELKKDAVIDAIRKACSKAFRDTLDGMENPFYKPNTAKQIADVLVHADLEMILKKRFFDYFHSDGTHYSRSKVLCSDVLYAGDNKKGLNKKCLIVGYGSIGKRHAKVLSEMGCSVACVSRHGTADYLCYPTLEEAIRLFVPSYVLICNRTSEHVETMKELYQSGYYEKCFIEKPIAATMEQVNQTPELDIAVGYVLRFHPLIERAKEILRGQHVLSVNVYVGQYLPDWRPGTDYRDSYSAKRKMGGGVLRDLSHELDYIQFLAGGWEKVVAHGGHRSGLSIDSDDQFIMLMQTQRCEDVVCHLDYLSHITRRYCQIQYEGGTLALDFIANTLSHNDEVLILKADRNDLLQRMHETILLGQTVENDQVCTCKDARMTMELIDAIERSAKEGKWICRETL